MRTFLAVVILLSVGVSASPAGARGLDSVGSGSPWGVVGARHSEPVTGTPSLEQRTLIQRRIEDVYWRHKLWPAENPQPKPRLEAVMPLPQIRAKVEDALRRSQALQHYTGRTVSGPQLQREMERMARETRQPGVLRELWEAVGNDPAVIAEYLARPLLTDRMLRAWYEEESAGHGATAGSERQPFDLWWQTARGRFAAQAAPSRYPYQLPRILAAAGADDSWKLTAAPLSARLWHTAVWTGAEMIVWGGTPLSNPTTYTPAGRYNPTTDSWTLTTQIGAPVLRDKHSAVWTGTEMIVWGGNDHLTPMLNTGARYNPQTDTWTPTSTINAPAPRQDHSAVWTGSRMIVWGGASDEFDTTINTGGSYDPVANSWTALPTSNAPAGREYHRTVWTGSEMVVWGGTSGSAALSTGGRYNPTTNRWTPTATSGAPTARYGHSMVWTGSEVVVWGGAPGFFSATRYNTGARYNPATNSWTAISTTGAPAARDTATTVWTGSEMLVWGGSDGKNSITSGGRYNPSSNSWTSINATNAPAGVLLASAVWTGKEMIIWGGQEPINAATVNTGGRYDPATNTWRRITNPRNGGERNAHPAVWTGTEMIIWGGYTGFSGYSPSNTGARYTPATDTWVPTSMVNVPKYRYAPRAIWTGREMVVWGGCSDSFCFNRLNTGGRYNPQTDTWTPTSLTGAPEARYYHTTIWTGSEMVVWGGCNAQTCGPGGNADRNGLNSGGRYNPATNTWRPTSVTNAPGGRWFHSAVWTGSEMVIWGGENGSVGSVGDGSRYNPITNTWRATSTQGAPTARHHHTAVWTGTEMIVWGGADSYTDFNTGGRYLPAQDRWTPTSMANAPGQRTGHTAVWTGAEMIVWGGCTDYNCQTPLNTGGRYRPQADGWIATSTINAPPARNSHSAVWTGEEMIVFGGEWGARNPTTFSSGGRYFARVDTPPAITNVAFPVNPVVGCLRASGAVLLSAPAPAGGIKVMLSSTNPAASVPASAIVPAGASSVAFAITTTPVTTNQTGSVTATAGGVSKSAALVVRPIGVASVALQPNPAKGGVTVAGTVTLECAAAPGAITVMLSSNNPTVANPTSASVTIPAGSRQASISVGTTSVTANTSVTIRAATPGASKGGVLTVTP